jgi:hypothetical protein
MVGLLHALQPFVRLWGRIRGHPLPPLRSEPDSWSGDREVWLRDLTRHLAQNGVTVRPARPHREWDLVAAVGPFLAARLTTAVLWHWQPTAAVAWRVRMPLPLAAAGVVLLAATAGPVAGSVASAALVVLACVEAARLRSRVLSAIGDTTQAAVTAGCR